MAKKKRGAPLKTCPQCNTKLHARKSECECGHCFYTKKVRLITDWRELKIGDIVRSVYGNGPYWQDPTTEEKIYMGSYGKFEVQGFGRDYIKAYEISKFGKRQVSGGTHILYMGKFKKSVLCDNLYNCPHKLVSVSLKGESK